MSKEEISYTLEDCNKMISYLHYLDKTYTVKQPQWDNRMEYWKSNKKRYV